jgi:hypothetical protein
MHACLCVGFSAVVLAEWFVFFLVFTSKPFWFPTNLENAPLAFCEGVAATA